MSGIRRLIGSLIYRQPVLKSASVGYCSYNGLLPEILVRTPSNILREMFGLPFNDHVSQLNQDIFALLVNRFQQGFFVEIGANDGFTLSNTIYLEECFGWRGLLVEANPAYLPDLLKRKAMVVNKAVAASDGVVEFVDAGLYGGVASTIDLTYATYTAQASKIRVQATTLEAILMEAKSPPVIDFISIDVEGGELPIVEQMCASNNYRFLSGCIEHNYRKKELAEFKSLLNVAGYRIAWEDQTLHDLYFVDSRSGR